MSLTSTINRIESSFDQYITEACDALRDSSEFPPDAEEVCRLAAKAIDRAARAEALAGVLGDSSKLYMARGLCGDGHRLLGKHYEARQ